MTTVLTRIDGESSDEIENFIKEILKKGEVTFTLSFKSDLGWQKEKDMVDKVNYTEDISAGGLKSSLQEVNKLTKKDIEDDLNEINSKRDEIWNMLLDFHRKESVLVNRLRTLQLEDRILNEV